jgi:GT2 family glycosyltransferase
VDSRRCARPHARPAVAAAFPEVSLIQGDGSLFWNGGMRKAWQTALAADADYYLWWNDDLALLPEAIDKLLDFQRGKEAVHGSKVISIGKVTDPDTGEVTYGGYGTGPGLSKLRFVRMADDARNCDTMNGNCVLIPACAVDDLGIHSPHFTHGFGDIDYGLRAKRAGYLLFQTPFTVGHTPFNEQYVVNTSRLTWSNRHFILRHPKGLPVREWLYFCRAHGGPLWPINFITRYLKILRLSA